MWTSMDWNVVLTPVVLVVLLALVSFLLGGAVKQGEEDVKLKRSDAEVEGTVRAVRGVAIAKTGSDMAGLAGSAEHFQPGWKAQEPVLKAASAASDEARANADTEKAAAAVELLQMGGLFGPSAKKAAVVAERKGPQMSLPLAETSAVASVAAVAEKPVDVNTLLALALAQEQDEEPGLAEWDAMDGGHSVYEGGSGSGG